MLVIVAALPGSFAEALRNRLDDANSAYQARNLSWVVYANVCKRLQEAITFPPA
jgi:hypothetical protein